MYKGRLTKFQQLILKIASILVCTASIGLAGSVKGGTPEEFQINEIKKELLELSSKTDPISCAKIFQNIHRIRTIAGQDYFSESEYNFLTKNCKGFHPSDNNQPTPVKKPLGPAMKSPTKVQLPAAPESSDMQTKVTSRLNALAQEPASMSNCQKRAELIAAFDKLAEVDQKPSYSMEERHYFLKDCFKLLPDVQKVMTHKVPKPNVPTGFMSELKSKVEQHQKRAQEKSEAERDLDNLLAELEAEKQAS